MTAAVRELEAQWFRTLNTFVEPWVRAGVGSPGLIPAGLVVIETIGRKSGTPHRTPLAATIVEGQVLVSTARGRRSHWVQNAAAHPAVRYWMHGEQHEGSALVLARGTSKPPAELTPLLVHLARGPFATAIALGWAFAVIRPSAR